MAPPGPTRWPSPTRWTARPGIERVRENLDSLGVDALVAIGGEDTLGVANKLNEAGGRVVGVPKTIDNDLGATDFTFGFDTAVNIAMEAIDRLHTTAESHHRALIVEVMGRSAGWIALHAGIAGGANVILIPEKPFDIDQVCEYVEHRFQTRYAPIVVVSEGAHPKTVDEAIADDKRDAFGHARLGGIGQLLADEIEQRTGKEARCTVLGHIQRGGTPTAFDRVLATRFGVHAIRAVADGDVRHDGRAARHRHHPGAAVGGDQRAQAGAAGALCRGRGLLRLGTGQQTHHDGNGLAYPRRTPRPRRRPLNPAHAELVPARRALGGHRLSDEYLRQPGGLRLSAECCLASSRDTRPHSRAAAP